MANTKAAGRITGNPMCGLCERVCIEAKKIFDGCGLYGRNDNAVYVRARRFVGQHYAE